MKNWRSHRKPGKSPEKRKLVHSKAYGPHERAARGSRSKAELNEVMRAHGQRMIDSNLPAGARDIVKVLSSIVKC